VSVPSTWRVGPVAVQPVLASLGIVAAYLLRPVAMMWSLELQPMLPGGHYKAYDLHGFGVLGAFLSTLVLGPPVLWLLLHRNGPVCASAGRRLARGAAVLTVVGLPMLTQASYLPIPLEYGWPNAAACALWFALVAWLCVERRAGMPGVQAAFDRYPRGAWAVLGLVGAARFSVVVPAVVG